MPIRRYDGNWLQQEHHAIIRNWVAVKRTFKKIAADGDNNSWMDVFVANELVLLKQVKTVIVGTTENQNMDVFDRLYMILQDRKSPAYWVLLDLLRTSGQRDDLVRKIQWSEMSYAIASLDAHSSQINPADTRKFESYVESRGLCHMDTDRWMLDELADVIRVNQPNITGLILWHKALKFIEDNRSRNDICRHDSDGRFDVDKYVHNKRKHRDEIDALLLYGVAATNNTVIHVLSAYDLDFERQLYPPGISLWSHDHGPSSMPHIYVGHISKKFLYLREKGVKPQVPEVMYGRDTATATDVRMSVESIEEFESTIQDLKFEIRKLRCELLKSDVTIKDLLAQIMTLEESNKHKSQTAAAATNMSKMLTERVETLQGKVNELNETITKLKEPISDIKETSDQMQPNTRKERAMRQSNQKSYTDRVDGLNDESSTAATASCSSKTCNIL